jgi:DNA-directed RNA polymerase specialized sigma24 family protein
MSRNYESDQVLIDRLRLNDTEAFEELFRRYWHNLYIYSLKKLHSSNDSRQIVRDIFKELWEKRQEWPVDFSLSQHLYAEVRKEVVKHLSKALTEESSPVITEEILPGFSVNSLQQAKIPVVKKHANNKPSELAKQQTIRRKDHTTNTMSNVKWLLNTLTARLN